MKKDALLYQNPDKAADRFLSALLSLLKTEKFKNITITQLCQEANLSRKTFYENFKKKDDLLSYFVNAGCIAYNKTDTKEEPLLHYFRYWYNLQDWVLALIENNMWYDINNETLKHYIPLLTSCNWKDLLGEQYKNKALVLNFLNAAFSEVIRQWALHGFQESPEELTAMSELILSGVFITKP